MNDFSNWFQQSSGYALHRLRAKPLPSCCEGCVAPDGRYILLPSPDEEQLEKRPVCACKRCGRLYVSLPDGYAPIDNLLRYHVTNE